MQLRHARTGEKGLDAALLAAIALRAGKFVRLRPGQRVVAPLAGDAVGAGEDVTVDHNARAYPRADDHAEHDRCPCRRAIGRFGKRKAVGVVADLHLALQHRFEVLQDGLAVEHDRVGILQASSCAGERAGRADTDGAALPQFRFGIAHQLGDGLQGVVVIFLGGGYAAAQQLLAAVVERNDLYLRTA